jgi:bifunctional non-homologous end joining protein LigD
MIQVPTSAVEASKGYRRLCSRAQYESSRRASLDPEGSRKHFGALLVGFYEGKRLKFAGRVAIGFSEKLLSSLHSELEKIRIKSCPFYNVPAAGRSHWDQGLTAAEMKRWHWVKPSSVC